MFTDDVFIVLWGAMNFRSMANIGMYGYWKPHMYGLAQLSLWICMQYTTQIKSYPYASLVYAQKCYTILLNATRWNANGNTTYAQYWGFRNSRNTQTKSYWN